ncbi:MAG: SIR2 family NAD-dependent protein deacylase [Anaerovoracaceae bacterium]|jgi:NAD-dependent SIR2 family protein deacetylase
MFYSYIPEKMSYGLTQDPEEQNEILKEKIDDADAVLIGAGAGLSTSAGFTYSGKRFSRYFSDFAEKYDIRDMYSGGFYPFESTEEFWGYWCRYIWINRYAPIPSDTYEKLRDIVKDKDHFVLTTNVDHCFQRSGFDKERLFYTQGDYGLFQSSSPSGAALTKTYDNYDLIREMVISEGFEIGDDGTLEVPDGTKISMTVPSHLLPVCPDDGMSMTTNLRCDDSFVEDDGWHESKERYDRFVREHESGRVLYLELGVGMNTPVIIKFPFWRYTKDNRDAFYVCVNMGEACCPEEISKRSLCIDGDIDKVIRRAI